MSYYRIFPRCQIGQHDRMQGQGKLEPCPGFYGDPFKSPPQVIHCECWCHSPMFNYRELGKALVTAAQFYTQEVFPCA